MVDPTGVYILIGRFIVDRIWCGRACMGSLRVCPSSSALPRSGARAATENRNASKLVMVVEFHDDRAPLKIFLGQFAGEGARKRSRSLPALFQAHNDHMRVDPTFHVGFSQRHDPVGSDRDVSIAKESRPMRVQDFDVQPRSVVGNGIVEHGCGLSIGENLPSRR